MDRDTWFLDTYLVIYYAYVYKQECEQYYIQEVYWDIEVKKI